MKNRGMMLESIINRTIKLYGELGFGIFHKKDLSITFSKVQKEKNQNRIVNGLIKQKSTTDYYGIFQGRFVSFEAKSTQLKSLPFSNIHDHQHEYLRKIKAHGGLAFYIIGFTTYDEFFVVDVDDLDYANVKHLSIDSARDIGKSLTLIYPGVFDLNLVLQQML